MAFERELIPDLEKIRKVSKAVQAVEIASDIVRYRVAQKHMTRGDSYHRTTSMLTMLQLSHNKLHRLEEIYKVGGILPTPAIEAIKEELIDIIAYCSFQIGLLEVDKITDVNETGEKETGT